MPYTREQWISGALQELGVLAAGQQPSAEDSQAVSDRIESVIGDLGTRSIWFVGDADEIEDEAYNHLCVVLAQAVARQFGVVPDEAIRRMAESRLREVRAEELSGAPQATDYF